MQSENKKTHWIICGGFALLIGIPFLGTLFAWDLYPQQNENRKPAGRPDLRETTCKELPKLLELYCNDHFGFRNTLIHHHQRNEKKFFNRGTRKVLKGKTPGWYFFKQPGTIADFMGNRQLTTEELGIWKTTLEERKQFLAGRNIPYVFFVCPDKPMVYPEHLPDETRNSRGQTRFEQLQKYIHETSDFEIIYPLSELLAEKQEHELYFPGDTHWNIYGGYVGYKKLMQQIRLYFPEVEPVPFEDCPIEVQDFKPDLASMYYSKSMITNRPLLEAPASSSIKTTPCAAYTNALWEAKLTASPPKLAHNPVGKRTALIIHDSFIGHGVSVLLPVHFRDTYFFFMYIETPDLKQLVDDLNPDIVIELRVERSLRFIPGRSRDAE